MTIHPVANRTRLALAGAVLMLALPLIGLAQITPFQDISNDDIDALDEIVVYGQPTLRQMRKEIFMAEENFYELFNSLNGGKEFDISCFYRKNAKGHVRRRVCEAYFVKGAHAGANFAGSAGPPAWAFIRHKNRQMKREMAALVDEHAGLQRALLEFAQAKQDFDIAVHERCANILGVCKN